VAGVESDDLVVAYVDDVAAQQRERLSICWSVEFEAVHPVRKFASRPGRTHFPGLWWFAMTGRHVGYESWQERERVMALDFDPEVVGVAAQNGLWEVHFDRRANMEPRPPHPC
jgi:hypothetical protein